ncbi:ABC-2 type transport system permease protein [Nocardiopsis sp. Huas11]|uniref:ABC transporter permease n=1 Tax=Nocardiopsis sp. Huas11 TaxID=2183912 RepID=UPI000EB09518|nr:anibiotic ABC transporter efflux pump [Nocardiopsis sp. Huas11]RKS05264.1 ABC-2 type transport system permease protein [Nocardiopsis sp. Huas11]
MRKFAGTGHLIRFILRRDRIRMTVWTAALVGTLAMTIPTLDEMFQTPEQRLGRAAVMETPTGIVFGGPGYGLDSYGLGAMIANELTMSLLVALAIMSILHVVRHTRAEEESGRAELLRANVMGSSAQMTAALATNAVVNAVIGALSTLCLVAGGLDRPDSVAYGLGLALAGITFGAIAAVCAQVSEHSRGASGLAFLVVGVLFMFRVVGDIAERGGSAPSWFSPFAWTQQTRIYDDLRWWPLALYAVVIVVLFATAFTLAGRRDLGAGLVAARPGPADASPLLNGVFAVHLRQQRTSIVAWAVAVFLFALSFGTLISEIDVMIEQNPELVVTMGLDAENMSNAFLGMLMLYIVMATAAFAMLSVLRVRAEESAGRAELTLSAAVGRIRWLGSAVLVSTIAAVVMTLLGGVGMGLGAGIATDDYGWVATVLEGSAAQLPVVLLFIGLTTLAVGVAPRLVGLVWAWFGYGLTMTIFGRMLDLPDWMIDLGPFGIVSQLPLEEFDAVPFLAVLGAAAAAGAVGLGGFRRRDLATV